MRDLVRKERLTTWLWVNSMPIAEKSSIKKPLLPIIARLSYNSLPCAYLTQNVHARLMRGFFSSARTPAFSCREAMSNT